MLTLIWVGFVGIRLTVRGLGGKVNYSLSKTRWNYARNFKYVVLENIG